MSDTPSRSAMLRLMCVACAMDRRNRDNILSAADDLDRLERELAAAKERGLEAEAANKALAVRNAEILGDESRMLERLLRIREDMKQLRGFVSRLRSDCLTFISATGPEIWDPRDGPMDSVDRAIDAEGAP